MLPSLGKRGGQLASVQDGAPGAIGGVRTKAALRGPPHPSVSPGAAAARGRPAHVHGRARAGTAPMESNLSANVKSLKTVHTL